jgi:O-6-methylguanine DNA methyltransferase
VFWNKGLKYGRSPIFLFVEILLMDIESIKTKKDVIEALKDKTPFERDVYVATFEIPKGKISTYKRIAEKVGKPKAYRAVANALHKNPLSPVVPCHRVVGSDGSFGGDKKGAEWRRTMVKNEGIPVEKGKVKINNKILH